MSQENLESQQPPPEILELVMENFEWWNDGKPELMLDSYTEDGELDLSAVFTDTPIIHGRENMRRQTVDFWESWEGLRMDSLEVIRVDDRRFVVDVRLWGKGKRSGANVDQRFAFLYTLHPTRNKVVRAKLFPTVQEAIDFASSTPAESG
jgi:ketosteroid isomerase-like protein